MTTLSPARPEDNCPYVADGPTTLRCSKCNKPLMPKDAKRTPTGYVCPYYIKARVATFYNAQPVHYAVVAGVALALGIAAGFVLKLVGTIGFFAIILTLFVGPAIGGIVAEVIRRLLKGIRGQYFWAVAGTALAIGAAYFTLLPIIIALLQGSPGFIWGLIPVGGLALAVSTLAARMRV